MDRKRKIHSGVASKSKKIRKESLNGDAALIESKVENVLNKQDKKKKGKGNNEETISTVLSKDGYTAGGLSGLFGRPTTVDETIQIPTGETKITATVPKQTDQTKNRELQRDNRKKIKKMTAEEKERTIFVGNMPLTANEKSVKKIFAEYGKIESVRVRGLIPSKETLTKRIAHVKTEYNKKQTSLIFYVKFAEKESVAKALEKNGETIDDHRIRVDVTSTKKNYDKDYTIFIGNLPFNATEDQISVYFEKEVGPVSFSRLVKDNSTGKSRGVAFVSFKDTSSIDLALHMNGCTFDGRELRISKTLKKNQIAKRVEAAAKHKKLSSTTKQPSKVDKYKFSTRNNGSADQTERKKLKKSAKKAIGKKKNAGNKKSLMQ